jgi:hypothetical protein
MNGVNSLAAAALLSVCIVCAANAQSPPAAPPLTDAMRSCLAESWFPVVLASIGKPKLHADDKDDDPSVLWGRILGKCDVRANEESAATDYVKGLMHASYPPKAERETPLPAPTEAQDRRPKKIEVCGPDHWQRDHWEPSCR